MLLHSRVEEYRSKRKLTVFVTEGKQKMAVNANLFFYNIRRIICMNFIF